MAYKPLLLLLFCLLLVGIVSASIEDNFNRANTNDIDGSTATNLETWVETDYTNAHWQILNNQTYFSTGGGGGANAVRLPLNNSDPTNITFVNLYINSTIDLLYFQLTENACAFADPDGECRNIEFYINGGTLYYRNQAGTGVSTGFVFSLGTYYNLTAGEIDVGTDEYKLFVNGTNVTGTIPFYRDANDLNYLLMNSNTNTDGHSLYIDCVITDQSTCPEPPPFVPGEEYWFNVTASYVNEGSFIGSFTCEIDDGIRTTTTGSMKINRTSDLSGNGNDATNNGATYDKLLEAYEFDGVTGSLSLDYDLLLSINNAFTVSFNFTPISKSSNKALVGHTINASNRWGCAYFTTDVISCGAYNGTGWATRNSQVGDWINKTINVVWIHNITTSKLYLNGVLATGSTQPSIAATQGFNIGATSAGTNILNGTIYNFKIENSTNTLLYLPFRDYGNRTQTSNVTCYGSDYYEDSYLNVNTSKALVANLSNTVITASSGLDGSSITSFSASYGGYTENTTNGTIYTIFGDRTISNTSINVTVTSNLYFPTTISTFAWGNSSATLFHYPFVEFLVYNYTGSYYQIDDWTVSLYTANNTVVSNDLSDNLTILDATQYNVTQDGNYHLLASWLIGDRNLNGTAVYFRRYTIPAGSGSGYRSFNSSSYPFKIRNLSAWTYSNASNCFVVWNATNVTGETTTVYTDSITSCSTGEDLSLGFTSSSGLSLNASFTNIYPSGYFNSTGTINSYLNTTGYNVLPRSFLLTTNTTSYTVTYTIYARNTFNITFYNETSNELWPSTVYYEIVSPLEARNGNTSTGSVVESLLTPSDYAITYWYDGTYRRDYYVTLTNNSFSNIRLYLVDTNSSDFYIPVVTDGNDQACNNLTISLLRYFVDINGYRVVEMATTDTNGQAIVRVVPNIINYKLYFNGACGNFITEPSKLITSTDRYTVTEAQSYFTSSNSIAGASINFTYNNNTQTYVFSWADSTNIVTKGCMYIYKTYRGLKTTNYSSCSNASTGSLIYTLAGNLTDTVWSGQGILDTSTTYSTYSFSAPGVSFLTSITAWGITGVFWGLFIIIGLVLVSAYSSTTIVFSAIGGLIVLITLGIIAGTASAVAGLLILGVVVLYKLKS